MDPQFADRMILFFIGCAIGFFLGYLVRGFRDVAEKIDKVKEELDEVDEVVKEFKHSMESDDDGLEELKHDEKGAVDLDFLKNVALLLVVLMTAFAAFSSQRASDTAMEAQEKTDAVAVCNQRFLSRTITALNERTEYNVQQTDANVKLQSAQAEYLKQLLIRPPRPGAELRRALRNYVKALDTYIDVTAKSKKQVVKYPYPTNEELGLCLSKSKEE